MGAKSILFWYYCVETQLNTFATFIIYSYLGMNLPNKLLAGFTAMSMVAMSFVSVPFNVAADSAENQAAYDWAFAEGLTTMTSLNAFNFEGNVTREAAARFLTQGAEALGYSMYSNQNCEYTDLASADQSLVEFINQGCEMGVFKAQDMFNPKQLLTRAQAELTVARIVYGMDEVAAYATDNNLSEYAAARELLMEDGIINFEIPAASAVKRGHLILMLYRLADIVDPTDPTNPTDPIEVKAGNLDVSLNSATLANNSQIPAVGVVRFAAVNFSAGSSDINLKNVEISKVGLVTPPSSTRVWFEKNGVRVTGKAAFTSEGKAVVSFAPVMTVKAKSTETLDLYVELTTTAGNDFQFASAMIDSSAQNVNGSFTTPVLRTVNYTVIASNFNLASIGGTSNVTANGMELGAFRVDVMNPSSETRNASFKSITLRQNGTASLTNLSNIVLERNGVVVSSNPTINGRDITFSVNDTILDATSATYYIKAVVNNVDQSTDTYQLQIRTTSDVNIVEANTAFRTIVTPAANPVLNLNTYNIQGGDITFARDTSVALSNNVAPGSNNVILMKGTMKSNSAITVEDPTVAYLNGMTDASAFLKFSTVYLQIGSSTFSYSPAAGGAATAASFLGTATVNGTVPVKMWATLKQTAPTGSIKFGSLQLSNFALAEYVSNGNTVATAVGSIEGINVTVDSTNLNLTRTDGKGNSVVAAGTTDFTVVKFNATSTQGNGVKVSRAEFVVNAAGSYLNNVTLSLLVNGQVVQTKNVQGGTVFFDNFNTNITSASGATFEVKANFAEAFSAGSFGLTLNNNLGIPAGLNAVDLVTSAGVTYSALSSAVFTIGSANAQVTASNSPILPQLLLSPSTGSDLVAFRVKALNDTVKLRDLTFNGTNLDKLTNFRVVDSSNNVVAVATTATATTVTFTNIADAAAPAIAKDAIATYTLRADVNSDTNSVSVNANLTSLSVRASNGTTVTPVFAAVASATHMIAENTFTVAKAANASKGLTTSALRFTVTAAGKDSVVLNSLNFNNLFAGYVTAGAQIKVYKTSTTAANLAGQTVAGTVTGPVTLSANNSVDAGTTATYIVVIENAVVDGGSNSQDWSVSLTDIDFGAGLLATNYNNVGGALAITESK